MMVKLLNNLVLILSNFIIKFCISALSVNVVIIVKVICHAIKMYEKGNKFFPDKQTIFIKR